MNLRQSVGFVLHACGAGALLVLFWIVWLVLIAGIGFQLWIITRRELSLPDFALRAIERRLAASEVAPRFGRAVFDPTGRVLLENVELFSPDGAVPIITVRAAYVSAEFWPLLVGDFRVREVRLTGLDLRIPAMLSPSGTDEAVVSDLDGIFQVHQSDYTVAACTFRVAGVAVTGRGGFHLPAGIHTRPGSMKPLDLVLERYLQAGRALIALRPQLETLEESHLELTLVSSPVAGAVVEADLLVGSSHPDAACTVRAARARTAFPLLGAAPVPVAVAIEARRLGWRDQVQIEGLRGVVAGSFVPDRFAFLPETVRMAAAGGRGMAVSLVAPVAEVRLAQWPRLQGDGGLLVGGSVVSAHADVEIKQGEGRLDLSGALTPAILRLAAERFGVTPVKWVTLTEPAPLHATIDLAAGWKPVRSVADFSVRHVMARDVPIDAASGHIVYAGQALDVSDITLHQGENEAYGSYSMDTASYDYRFLLHGRLRPGDISGWFTEWWPDFWSSFDFTAAPAAADVDVMGRWGTAEKSSVYCFADAAGLGLRSVPFDRVRTTLFYQSDCFEVFHFNAEHAGHGGRGSFTVTVNHDQPVFRSIDFDAVSDLDIHDCARMWNPATVALAAPLQFATPPAIRLNGHLDGPGTPDGARAHISFAVTTNDHFTVHGFPLDSGRFTAEYADNSLDSKDIEIGFAGGTVTGRANVHGPPAARVLSFDASLAGADLARAIGIFDEFSTTGSPAGPERSRDRKARPTPAGRLDVKLNATGSLLPPFNFRGDGRASVAGQALGEIHLLGLLSELLSKTLLNFTSLRLDSAQANFRLEGNKLVFPKVELQGPRALINARGEYLLADGTLDFNARVFPLKESKFIFADALGALLTPLSDVLELKLTGPLAKPSWAFAFGPTSFLRALTRPANGPTPAPVLSAPSSSPPGVPPGPPLLP